MAGDGQYDDSVNTLACRVILLTLLDLAPICVSKAMTQLM